MIDFNNLYQAADWKKEKHTPVIEIERGEKEIKIKLMVGKEIAHPNTTAHHIRWIDCYFLPKGEKFPYQIGKAEFCVHGASVEGPDTSKLSTKPAISFVLNTEKTGTIIAASFCNIHGLWRNTLEV